MERDGVALVSFMRRFEEALAAGQELTETDVDDLLTACRAAQPGYKGLSFATIAGYGSHGAVVHYEATPQSAARWAITTKSQDHGHTRTAGGRHCHPE